jgi:hypothetical protein
MLTQFGAGPSVDFAPWPTGSSRSDQGRPPPRSALGQIDAELQDLQTLIIDMARSEAA